MSEARVLQLPGVNLWMAVQDGGPTTIFLHGFGGDLHSWNRLLPLLPAERSYIRYDLRGFGQSVPRTSALFDHADDLTDLMDAMQIDHCDVVGLSMGGSIALNFALNRPDRVRSLSLLSPGLTGWDWSDEWRSHWRPIAEAAQAGNVAQARALWLAHPLFATTRASNLSGMLQDEIARFSGNQWVEDHQAPALPDVERLHQLEVPVLLLTGARDLADFRLVADLIEACAPNTTRHDASDTGHLIHLEAPDWCRDRLVAFWGGAT